MHDLYTAARARDDDNYSIGWNSGKLHELRGILHIYRTTA